MFGSRSKCIGLVLLVIVNGVLIEVYTSYQESMGRATHVMPGVRTMKLPRAFHHSPLAETPVVKSFDGMLLTSATMAFYDEFN